MSDLPKRGIGGYEPEPQFPPYAPDKYFYSHVGEGAWKGRRCFIIGGGPSLKGFDFSRLKGELVIAVNRAWEHSSCAITFFLDEQFWGWTENGSLGKYAQENFLKHPSYKVTVNRNHFPYPEGINVVDYRRKAESSDTLREGIYCGCNSGFAALNLAVAMGAKEIYLLGFDMDAETDPQGKLTHYHNGYPEMGPNADLSMFRSEFHEIAPNLKAKDIWVINLNSQSYLKAFEFGDLNKIKPIHRPIIISFYTPEYADLAERMRRSANFFGLETDIVSVEKKGSWVETMYTRAQFILDMLDKHGRDVVWLDSDAVIHKYPELFDDFKGDFGVHYATFPWREEEELLGGTMYFANTHKARELIEIWLRLNKELPRQELTQWILQQAVQQWDGTLVRLPPTYTQIFDLMADRGDPVIEHFQASRKFRRTP
jgi:hypothetical protein